jgi:porin
MRIIGLATSLAVFMTQPVSAETTDATPASVAPLQDLGNGQSGRPHSHIHTPGEIDETQLVGFFRLGYAAGRFNQFDRFASAGLRYTGLIGGRDADEMGIAVASAFASKDYRLANSTDRRETVFELTYRAQLAS